jgi:DNA ligase (NAD+)
MRWRISQLELWGLKMQVEDNGLKQTLEGKAFCITGTLSVGREEMKALILAHGGIFQSSVSSKTGYLVVGEGGGGKADKAKKLGVQAITEEELRKMIDG